jgi:hypothetical protein
MWSWVGWTPVQQLELNGSRAVEFVEIAKVNVLKIEGEEASPVGAVLASGLSVRGIVRRSPSIARASGRLSIVNEVVSGGTRHPGAATGATHLRVGVRIAKTHSGFFAGLISTQGSFVPRNLGLQAGLPSGCPAMQVTRDSTPVVVRAGRREAGEPHTKTRSHEAECRSRSGHRSLTGQCAVEQHPVGGGVQARGPVPQTCVWA